MSSSSGDVFTRSRERTGECSYMRKCRAHPIRRRSSRGAAVGSDFPSFVAATKKKPHARTGGRTTAETPIRLLPVRRQLACRRSTVVVAAGERS
ncbi:hypothetical protein HPB50_015395 [Hyalomma asiaticum]|uniref:Uncharacterized protein n=1 Tax=Hyalomma asiaticum TaxID=266040 RepID=A0ACB7TIC2_HYAAI|nr:hypothetical protein HPB50_015395 [Hyalomma asiaticum]